MARKRKPSDRTSAPGAGALIDAARAAVDDGFRIIAAGLNNVLKTRGVVRRIKSRPPPPDATLADCRRRLLEEMAGLRAKNLRGLPDDADVRPWRVGERGLLGINGTRSDIDDEFRGHLASLAKIEWREKSFNWNVIEPFEKNRAEWLEWFDDLRRRHDPPVGKPGAPSKNKALDTFTEKYLREGLKLSEILIEWNGKHPENQKTLVVTDV